MRGARSGVFTRALVTCLAVTSAVHAAVYVVNAVLPLHLVALGGSKTQVGLLFSVATVVSMFLRPLVGGWNDRFGFRAVVIPGTVVLAATVLALIFVDTPAAVIALMLGMGLGNGLISTSAGVLASRATAPERRGEALSIYYVATASSRSRSVRRSGSRSMVWRGYGRASSSPPRSCASSGRWPGPCESARRSPCPARASASPSSAATRSPLPGP